MTGHEFRAVDIDLLADYVGGALDGTPDEHVVAALVADDPAWRDAHAALSDAVVSVAARLGALGTQPARMPDDIAMRLDAALAELPAVGRDEVDGPAAAGEPTVPDGQPRHSQATPGAGRHLTAVPDTDPDGQPAGATTDLPAITRSRRVRRWAAPIAVAAGALAIAGLGVGPLLVPGGAEDAGPAANTSAGDTYGEQHGAPMMGSGEAEDDVGAPAAAGALVTAPTADQITTSGINYRPASLGRAAQLPQGPTPASDSPRASAKAPASDGGADPAGPAELRRLRVGAALLACLEAIARLHGAGPIAVASADFASFESQPALIVRFSAGNGDWAWAVGPECGAPGAGADPRYRVQVG